MRFDGNWMPGITSKRLFTQTKTKKDVAGTGGTEALRPDHLHDDAVADELHEDSTAFWMPFGTSFGFRSAMMKSAPKSTAEIRTRTRCS